MNPKVCFGKPTIRNKRYPVEIMLDLLAAGMSIEEILEDYPDLEKEDLLACILFAKETMKSDYIYNKNRIIFWENNYNLNLNSSNELY